MPIVTIARYYRMYPIRIVKGYMHYVWDDRGNMYVDANAGHGAAFLGHANPAVVNAVKAQLEKILVVPINFQCDARDEFARNFGELLPPPYAAVYLQNTGTEAVELALKIAKKVTKRKIVVAFANSFHGRTMGSLSITWNERYRRPFEPLYPYVRFGKFNVIDGLDKLVDEDVCCIVVEPVQGEGGVNVATRDFLKALREVADERGALLIFDEIQCGFGRTGRTWAFQHYGVEPDLFTAGKALAGGLPIGVVVARREYEDVFAAGEHGSTFAGNPVVMVAASAATRAFLEEKVWERAESIGSYFINRLREVSNRVVLRAKGLGLMLGLELKVRAEPYIERLMSRGVLALTAGVNVIRFLPPYTIGREDVDKVVQALEDVLRT